MTGSTVHAPSLRLYGLAQDAYERALNNEQPHPVTGLSDVLVVVLMGVAAVEANVNELGALCSTNGLPAPMVALGQAVRRVTDERRREATVRKYRHAAKALGVPLDRGAQPYQNAYDLIHLRNAIVHVEPEVERLGPTAWKRPKVVRSLIERGLARDVVEDESEYWLDGVQTVAVAGWALEAAVNFMRHLTENLPTGHYLEAVRHRWDVTLLSPRSRK